MLTSITPLGERGRGNRWRTTSAWLIFGHVVGGFALGMLLAGAGALLVFVGVELGPAASTAVVSVAVLGSAVFDFCGGRMPGRRQVDERWLTKYRGWVYGLGFGAQLGLGFVTVLNTALFIAVCVAGVLVSAIDALILGVVYGTTRGLAASVNGRVRSTASLRRLHRLIDRFERPIRWGTAVGLAALALGAIVGVGPPRLTANGITVAVRDGWDVEFSELPGATPRSLVHLANFALPVERGDYGSGAVEIMGAAGIFVALMEFDAASASTALFLGGVMPTRLEVSDFSAETLQRRLPGQTGTQRFFVASGRAFGLYVVLGSSLTASLLVSEVNRILPGITID